MLVNRKLDVDGSDGVDVIRSAFACDNLSRMPFMLVSNYDDAQNQAVAAGARSGFGKAEFGDQGRTWRSSRGAATGGNTRGKQVRYQPMTGVSKYT